jgi:hypothetical protein
MLDYAKRGASAAAAEARQVLAKPSRCAKARWKPSNITAIKAWASLSYRPEAATPAPRIFPVAVRDTGAALSIASYTARMIVRPARAGMLARDCPDLDLYHPWDLPVDDAIALARVEQSALDADNASATRKARR